ncbi:hypothetical protein RDn1_240 [Candidatus Termititenax dinenymphae]|uniref:Uncharacterized protein n=1 Tax=Candidatus Termititenax dinenymphae TaxID=2218523 RepID=A0A388TL61_9BACT|nr:hypothetical protein RDn1_240 [Candidatus Termititenax dinenymphae]
MNNLLPKQIGGWRPPLRRFANTVLLTAGLFTVAALGGCANPTVEKQKKDMQFQTGLSVNSIENQRNQDFYINIGHENDSNIVQTILGTVIYDDFLQPSSNFQRTVRGLLAFHNNLLADDSYYNGLKREGVNAAGQDVMFIRQDGNKIVSESVYGLLSAAKMPYFGVTVEESQDEFNRLRHGFRMQIELGNLDKTNPESKDNFMAWATLVATGKELETLEKVWTEKYPKAGKLPKLPLGLKKIQNSDGTFETTDIYLTLDPFENGPGNSAADAESDYVMSLLEAMDNVKRGIWTDNPADSYQQEFLDLIDPLADEYQLINGKYIITPSEDYTVDYTDLSYLSPETCYAIANKLEEIDKADPRIAAWRQRGDNSLEIIIACLEQNDGRLFERIVVDVDKAGNITVKPYTADKNYTQNPYAYIRVPERLAAGLCYRPDLIAAKRPVLEKLLAHSQDQYLVTQQLDAAMYLPLAVVLGNKAKAESLARIVFSGLSEHGISQERHQYYENMLIAKVLTSLIFPYNPQAELRSSFSASHGDSRLSTGFDLEADKNMKISIDPLRTYEIPVAKYSSPFYRQYGRFAFVINNSPTRAVDGVEFSELMASSQKLVNSEGTSYELLNAYADYENPERTYKLMLAAGTIDKSIPHDTAVQEIRAAAKVRIESLINGVIYLLNMNYIDTDTALKQLPWAVALDKRGLSIIQVPGINNFGSSSAADADTILLASLIKIRAAGLGTQELDNVIFQVADNFVQHVIAEYHDPSGNLRLLMTAGALIEVGEENGQKIYRVNTTYYMDALLQILEEYFTSPEGSKLADGSINYGENFKKLRADMDYLWTKVLTNPAVGGTAFGQDFPDTVYLRTLPNGGLEVMRPVPKDPAHPEKDPYYMKYRPRVDREASWRFIWSGKDVPDPQNPRVGYFAAGLQTEIDRVAKIVAEGKGDPLYYPWYVGAIRDKLDFSTGDTVKKDSEKVDFSHVETRFRVDHTVANATFLALNLDPLDKSEAIIWPGRYMSASGLYNHVFPLKEYKKADDEPKTHYSYHYTVKKGYSYIETIGQLRTKRLLTSDLGRNRYVLSINEALSDIFQLRQDFDHIDEAVYKLKEIITVAAELEMPDTFLPVSPSFFTDVRTQQGINKYLNLDITHAYLVKTYIETLSMRGYDNESILRDINGLLAIILRNSANDKSVSVYEHPVVRELYFNKLLMWNNLSAYERSTLDKLKVVNGQTIVDFYGFSYHPTDEEKALAKDGGPTTMGIYEHLKNPRTDQRQVRRVVGYWDGIPIDTRLLQIADLEKRPPEYYREPHISDSMDSLSDLLAWESSVGEVQRIVAACQHDEKQLYNALDKHLENLTKYKDDSKNARYVPMALVAIFFLDNPLINGETKRPDDPISADIKLKLAQKYLQVIDRSADSGRVLDQKFSILNVGSDWLNKFGTAYRNYYPMIYSAVELQAYKEVDNNTVDMIAEYNKEYMPGDNSQREALRAYAAKTTYDITKMLEIMRVVKRLPLMPANIELPQLSAADQAMVDLLSSRFYDDLYFDRHSKEYINMLCGLAENLLWPGLNLENLLRLMDARPYFKDTISQNDQNLYKQLRPLARALLDEYMVADNNWPQNLRFVSVLLRVYTQDWFDIRFLSTSETTTVIDKFKGFFQSLDLNWDDRDSTKGILEALWTLEKKAWQIGDTQSYATFRSVEAFVLSNYPWAGTYTDMITGAKLPRQNSASVIDRILNDPQVSTYDYTLKSISDMKILRNLQ